MVTRVTWKTLETIIKTKLKEGGCSGVLLTKGASSNNSHNTETNSIARLETWGNGVWCLGDERFHFRLKRLGYGWFNNSIFMFNSVVICFYHCLKGQMIF